MKIEEIKQAIAEFEAAQTKMDEADCLFSRRSSAYNFYEVSRKNIPILLEAAKAYIEEHEGQ